MRLKPIFAVTVAGLASGAVAMGTLLAAPVSAAPSTVAATAAAGPWDFDGDGDQDLAVGHPGQDEGGPGEVQVRYADASGFADPPVVLTHPDPVEGNDAFGASLASADLDLDGYADLVVGAPGYRQRDTHGSVTVFRGSATGLTEASAATVRWPRRADGDLVSFGRSVVVARLNSDRWPDIAVGAPDDDGDRGTDRSRVIVLRGGASGYAAERSWAIVPPRGTRWFGEVLAAGDVDADGHLDLVESGSYPDKGSHLAFLRGTVSGPHRARVIDTGWAESIAVGRVTGDRYPDIVVGRPFGRYDPTRSKPYVGAGRVTVFRGSANGPRAGVSVTQASPGVPGTQHYRDFFGQSVAVLDVNRNGRSEVVAGVPGADVGSVQDAGSVVLLRVGAKDFRRTGNRVVSQLSAGVAGDPRKHGGFGQAVSSLDVTGDRAADLLVASTGPFVGYDPDRRGTLTVLPVADGPLGTAGGSSYTGWFGYGVSRLPRASSSQ